MQCTEHSPGQLAMQDREMYETTVLQAAPGRSTFNPCCTSDKNKEARLVQPGTKFKSASPSSCTNWCIACCCTACTILYKFGCCLPPAAGTFLTAFALGLVHFCVHTAPMHILHRLLHSKGTDVGQHEYAYKKILKSISSRGQF